MIQKENNMGVSIIIQIILLILGFVFLIKGSDYFVEGSSSVASILKIPTIIVGLTVVAFGTSAPKQLFLLHHHLQAIMQ